MVDLMMGSVVMVGFVVMVDLMWACSDVGDCGDGLCDGGICGDG